MSSLSLPCLNEHVAKSIPSTKYKLQVKHKKLAMVSEPLLPVEDSDQQEIRTRDLEQYDLVLDKAVEADSQLVVEEEIDRRSSSLEYCFLCSQSGPVIEEEVCHKQKLKRQTISQSLLVLKSSGSNSASTPHLHVNLCDNLMGRKSTSASVLSSATFKVQQPGQNVIKGQSISSSLSKVTEMNDSCGLMCRICHGDGEEEELIRPCRCTGTVKHAHQSCILHWVSKSGNQTCELCNFKFKTRKESVKCFWKWRFPEVSTKGWLHIGLFIAFATMLLTSITWIIWSRVSRTPSAIAERTTEEVKFAYMVNGLFIALAVGGLYFDSLKHFKQYSKRWTALNRNVVVECYTLEQNSKTGMRSQHSTCTPNQLPTSDMAAEETQAAQESSHGQERADWV